jgi:hypothetical protein
MPPSQETAPAARVPLEVGGLYHPPSPNFASFPDNSVTQLGWEELEGGRGREALCGATELDSELAVLHSSLLF